MSATNNESYVQVAPDSTGKKIRNLQLSVVQPDGTTATVQLQVTVLADADGNLVASGPVHGAGLLRTHDDKVVELLTEMNDTLAKVLRAVAMEFEQLTEGLTNED